MRTSCVAHSRGLVANHAGKGLGPRQIVGEEIVGGTGHGFSGWLDAPTFAGSAYQCLIGFGIGDFPVVFGPLGTVLCIKPTLLFDHPLDIWMGFVELLIFFGCFAPPGPMCCHDRAV